MNGEVSVHVVDSDPVGREFVASLVISKGVKARTYNSAEQFLAVYDASQAGCLVVCVELEGISGLELQRRLIDDGVTLPVIMVAVHGDIPLAVAAMSAGAINFLEKPCQGSELWGCIELAIAKNKSQRQLEKDRVKTKDRIAQLTDGETAVLRCMIAGLLNKQTKDVLDIGLRTVELRRASIMQKLDASSLADVVRMAVIAGVEPCEKVNPGDSNTT